MLERGPGLDHQHRLGGVSIKGVPNRFVYGATKAAVIGLTKSVAADFVGARRALQRDLPRHGRVADPARRGSPPRPRRAGRARPRSSAAFIARQPMGRLGRADEIAALAVYLASDESRFTTGTTQVIDGGWSN